MQNQRFSNFSNQFFNSKDYGSTPPKKCSPAQTIGSKIEGPSCPKSEYKYDKARSVQIQPVPSKQLTHKIWPFEFKK
jgi:hypothetical protein